MHGLGARGIVQGVLLSVTVSWLMSADPTSSVFVQIDAPFAPPRTATAERQLALETDHQRGKSHPTLMRVEVDGVAAFDGALELQGNRMTHVWYGKGSAPIPADSVTFVVRVRIEAQSLDEQATLEVKKGRWVVIARRKDGKPSFTQYTTQPLYR